MGFGSCWVLLGSDLREKPAPTFEKKPAPDPTFYKKKPDPTVEAKPDPDLFLEKQPESYIITI